MAAVLSADADPSAVRVGEAVWHDAARRRDLPLRLYRPAGPGPWPAIVFSHGLGGSRAAGEAWLRHWASGGFLGVALQHAGSDEARCGGASPLALRRLLKTAMTRENLTLRAGDVSFAVDELQRRRLADPRRVGVAGHSFGAATAQALAGERPGPGASAPWRDPRLKAGLALSPSARGEAAALPQRFGAIDIPFFSITGSRDEGIGPGDVTAAQRLLPHRHMPSPDKYLLVLAGGSHLHFSGNAQRRQPTPARLEAAVQAASLAFWHAHLNGDEAARRWLRAGELRGQLDPADLFEVK